MKRHVAFDEYLVEPTEGYAVGPTYLVWCHSACLSGIAFWGRVEAEHTTWLRGECGTVLHRVQLIDLRRVESMCSTAFDALTAYLCARAELPGDSVPGAALLRPDGFLGVTIAGLCKVYDFSRRVEVFTDPGDALAWLGAADALPVMHELDGLLCTVTGADSVLSAMRAHLARNPGKADLTTVSAALGMSGRALQRRLKGARTSFRAEQNAAQIQFAKDLLRDTNHEIKRIAFEVGCSSLAAFSALFRRIEGAAPSAWRSQNVPGEIRRRVYTHRLDTSQELDPVSAFDTRITCASSTT
jgi:AraC-like DNA-binding protein